jgi:hypothetical protein
MMVPVRNIEDIPILINGLSSQYDAELDIKTGNVRLEGSESVLNGFTPAEWFLSVDCSALSDPGVYTLPVRIDLPAALTLVRRDPVEVQLTLSRKSGSQ